MAWENITSRQNNCYCANSWFSFIFLKLENSVRIAITTTGDDLEYVSPIPKLVTPSRGLLYTRLTSLSVNWMSNVSALNCVQSLKSQNTNFASCEIWVILILNVIRTNKYPSLWLHSFYSLNLQLRVFNLCQLSDMSCSSFDSHRVLSKPKILNKRSELTLWKFFIEFLYSFTFCVSILLLNFGFDLFVDNRCFLILISCCQFTVITFYFERSNLMLFFFFK